MIGCGPSDEATVTEDGAMAMGKQKGQPLADFWVATERLAPARPFCQKLSQLLAAAACAPWRAAAP